MTDTRYILLASLLIDIECELRRANLWSAKPPSAEALASVEPFCVDTMDLQQWLQFIFLPRMSEMLTARAPLPQACNITAIADMVWASNAQTQALTAAIKAFDDTVNGVGEKPSMQ
jgi:uncharacterized protein YqcC (DUF446 family)